MELKSLIKNLDEKQLIELKDIITIELKLLKKEYSKICECGAKSVSKGLCRNCYSKYRSRKINGFRNIDYNAKFQEIYKNILQGVKDGLSIQYACKKANVGTRYFYGRATKEQKEELLLEKKINHKKYLINH